MTAEKPTVVEAINQVMTAVQAVKKRDRNASQGFNFRGVDAVVNAVGPALRDAGVVVVPNVESLDSERYETKKETVMRNVTVRVRWTFYGPAGDSFDATTYGEAADSGDKAVTKAQSVAFRVALLQALAIPTDEPDPDQEAHERAPARPPADPRQPLWWEIRTQGERLGWSKDDVADDFAKTYGGVVITSGTPEQLAEYRDHLKTLQAAPEQPALEAASE